MNPAMEALMPTDPIMRPPWVSCLSWALREPAIFESFLAETGTTYRPAHSPIELMVDEDAGRNDKILLDFVRWFNENIWGDPSERADVQPEIRLILEATYGLLNEDSKIPITAEEMEQYPGVGA